MNRLSTGCQPFVNRGFCSIGLHMISLVRASGKTFKRRVFDALERPRDACLLGELFCWHPVLPDPAPPPRRAPRPDPPVVCPGFGLDKSVYIAFRLFVLLGKRSGDVRPIPPRRPAVRPDPTRPWCPAVRRLLSTRPWCVQVVG